MVSIKDRYQGAMVGVLCGDALGAPYETWTQERILADVEVRGGLVLFDYDDPWGKDGHFPKGRPTDDSEMTAALAEHLLYGVNLEDLYRRFRKCVIDKKSFLCNLPAYGFGGTTRKALEHPTYQEALANSDPSDPIPSNGSLMRTVPVALRFHGFPREELIASAETVARMTHRHAVAIATTAFYVLVLDNILDGDSYSLAVEKALQAIPSNSDAYDVVRPILEASARKPKPSQKFRGGAVYSLRVVHWAVSTSYTFEEGIEKAVTIGGDTDTYAAIAGGLLGALHGVHAIPDRWRSGLLGHERMSELGTLLHYRNVDTK